MQARPHTRLEIASQLLIGLNGLQRAWEARWRQICDDAGMHASQAQALLLLLDRGPETMQQLARGLCVAPSTATRIVEQMEKVHWVTRSVDPDDRRRVLVHLLPTGEEQAWTLQATARQELWRHTPGLEEPERALQALETLGQILAPND
ncbi:hypothetical protein DRQ32_11795 [bacterium]|nr:MAG: hypothetical protein DRQ32_11795 [bacterium]